MTLANTRTVAVLTVLGLGLGLSACKKQADTDNPDVAAGYRGADNHDYETDIVTADRTQDYDDQGQGISPEVLQNIDDTILTVYLKDIERCLEDEMSEAETRFMRSAFLVEFTIDTAGKTSQGKVLEIETRKQTAKGADAGAIDSANMKACIETSVTEWEFDPAPEIDFKHTYRGRVGEAF
jgi:hypothetical protein